MKKETGYYDLGATLYIPAIHKNIKDITLKNKYNNLKSIVICLEDSITDEEEEEGINNIKEILSQKLRKNIKIFIRPRNIKNFKELLQLKNINKIEGFSIPKFDTNNMTEYLNIFRNHNNFYFMPILETKDVFSYEKLLEIATALEPFKEKVLSIRIGSEDILSLLHIKRQENTVIYDILPFHIVVSNILSIFRPINFHISAPVCNNFTNKEILYKEIEKEKEYGIYNKTIIHPKQINLIQDKYKQKKELFNIALRIIEKKEAVFADNGNMYEYKTHKNWAFQILQLGKKYGTI